MHIAFADVHEAAHVGNLLVESFHHLVVYLFRTITGQFEDVLPLRVVLVDSAVLATRITEQDHVMLRLGLTDLLQCTRNDLSCT